ncbi:hypothetical protein RchiOBHm_Chr2g0165131 [Rosa chinensis]|uniref:Uncharacterized protein n=1 Tax=Rosa chinensis TaxID=74649 RepID=A0A2P6S3Q5_ROSCH|nr:hypothetical protein RchiOBHm_Chr2g0165131 [Rosa chinensis]
MLPVSISTIFLDDSKTRTDIDERSIFTNSLIFLNLDTICIESFQLTKGTDQQVSLVMN